MCDRILNNRFGQGGILLLLGTIICSVLFVLMSVLTIVNADLKNSCRAFCEIYSDLKKGECEKIDEMISEVDLYIESKDKKEIVLCAVFYTSDNCSVQRSIKTTIEVLDKLTELQEAKMCSKMKVSKNGGGRVFTHPLSI